MIRKMTRGIYSKGETGTSRPKARDGHRYPCPVLVALNGGYDVSRAAVPEGAGGGKVL